MTLQEIFDISVGQIIKQGGLSKKANGMCAYRGDGGMMCAAGALMDDETAEAADALDPENGTNVYSIWKAGMMKGFDGDDVRLMGRLQGAHDHSDDVGEFVVKAKRIATQERLEWRFA